MKAKGSFLIMLLVLAAVVLITGGCLVEGARVGELQTRTETVEYDGAESILVDIDMAAGQLDISGGARELLEATFTYNVDELNPTASLSGDRLTVAHENIQEGFGALLDLDDYRNEWELQFADDVPMEMRVELGAGRSDLTLGSLALSKIDVDAGAGEVNLNLSDSQTLQELEFNVGAGEVIMDFTGNWKTDLSAKIDGGVGELSLLFPQDVGVIVIVDSGIGEIKTSGLTKAGDTYINDAYGESDITLEIDVDAGIGQINLEG
jgi:hypothetical protein